MVSSTPMFFIMFLSLSRCEAVYGMSLAPASTPYDDQSSDLQSIYRLIMEDMKNKFDAGLLTDKHKADVTRVISETQSMLADHSFAVLRPEKGEPSQQEILKILSAYRSSGNMTKEQTLAMQNLAIDTQVKMVQELLPILGLGPEYLGTEKHQLEKLMNRRTFTKYADGLSEIESLAPEKELGMISSLAPVTNATTVITETSETSQITAESSEEVPTENEFIDGAASIMTITTIISMTSVIKCKRHEDCRSVNGSCIIHPDVGIGFKGICVLGPSDIVCEDHDLCEEHGLKCLRGLCVDLVYFAAFAEVGLL